MEILCDFANKIINIEIPLTQHTGKIRIKERNTFECYGMPVATRQKKFDIRHYVEWQIGYDTLFTKNRSFNQNFYFIGANGYCKTLYELSEIIFYGYKLNFIHKNDLIELQKNINLHNDNCLIESVLKIEKENFVCQKICDIDFYASKVKYPLLVKEFTQDYISEIIIRERQYAIGIQAMLYYCFPISSLMPHFNKLPLLGRTAEQNETAILQISKNNFFIFFEMLKIFGILSIQHRYDINQILEVILKN
ncbi:R.Pab1 family restriction endonuclease [Campylobacter jejuni]|nr:R.Pab1 family restriction endonuclease [Campylobacter jejuni]EME0204953.1 R.Pab1 family restriction endonuclease [Campylobacter jejuni]MPB19630.1 R.Pab1 family restriction endonuclease [Campylobacter jejuni]